MKRFAFAILLSIAAIFAIGFTVYLQTSAQHHKARLGASDEQGPVSNATVSFGGWMTNTPIDRFPNNANTQFPRLQNHHALTPTIANIKPGGTVNFIIGGFHVVAVYDANRVLVSQIDTTNLVTPANAPAPPIINDPNGRIYRGLDPSLLPPTAAQDRVEVVHFDKPGVYLVICAVLPHFQEGMYGYVVVTD